MEHLLLKAATTVTDEGTFTAVISTASIDRDGDTVDPDGLVRALHKWTATGKNLPLAWHHSTAAEHQIGHMVPASAHNADGKVVVDGWIDQSVDPAGKHAWRLVKSGTLGFSYGYLIEKSTPRGSGKRGKNITDLDVFEITATPIPANNETRVLGWKSLSDEVAEELQALKERVDVLEKALENSRKAEETGKETKSRPVDPLRQQAESTALEFASDGLSLRKPPRQVKTPAAEPELPLQDLKRRMRDEILTHLSGEPE